jgi:hypothetical protein
MQRAICSIQVDGLAEPHDLAGKARERAQERVSTVSIGATVSVGGAIPALAGAECEPHDLAGKARERGRLHAALPLEGAT